jgi:anti-sigma factor RsiW
MNCAQFEWLAVDIAAGRIDAGDEARAHLARCERCRARLMTERRLTAGLRDLRASLAEVAAPARVEQALLARLRSAHTAEVVAFTPRGPRRAWRALNRLLVSGALAASVLALLSLVLVHAMHDGAALAPARVAGISHPEIATPFYPVYMTGAAVAGARGVVRVHVPRATLAVFGLPYNPRRATDPITADLVVDNGGVVTALRFVQ